MLFRRASNFNMGQPDKELASGVGRLGRSKQLPLLIMGVLLAGGLSSCGKGRNVDTTRRLIAAVAATVLAVSLAACSSSSRNVSNNSSQLPKASPAKLSTQDSSRLHLSLTSKKSATVAAALAPEVKAAYLKNPRQLLPDGSKLDILSDKMQVSGDTATVPAKVTGGANTGSYLLVLEKHDGKWLLIGTEKQ